MNAAPCFRIAPRGWWCSREFGHNGPCALRRRWWGRLLSRLTGRP